MLTTEKLIEYDRQGLIPGPDETEEEYLRRVEYCLHLREHLREEVVEVFGDAKETKESMEVLESAHQLCSPLYAIEPRWVPIIFSNAKLSPWHGGCAWIFQLDEQSPTAAILQLREKFEKSDQNRSSLYSRDEVVAHEIAHIGRMMFDEPKFEEVLAYRSAPSAFRRQFGPIVQSSKESGLFVLVLFMIVCLDLFFVSFGYHDNNAVWLKAIPLAMIGYGLYRVFKRQRQLGRCLDNLQSILGSDFLANAVAFRLTDDEIISFSESSIEEAQRKIKEKSGSSLRWHLLKEGYFSDLPN